MTACAGEVSREHGFEAHAELRHESQNALRSSVSLRFAAINQGIPADMFQPPFLVTKVLVTD